MRYIGSKTPILNFIKNTISETMGNDTDKTFADLFAGTTAVAKLFKELGYSIISNDYMHFSYIFQLAWIKNNWQPIFSELRNMGFDSYITILDYLNNIEGKEGFFYKNYTDEGSSKNTDYRRNYFSEENAKIIDSILTILCEWGETNKINEIEAAIIKTSLIDAVTKVSNTSGTYGAFLKIDDKRKFKKIKLEPIEFISNNKNNICYNKDIFEIIDEIDGDILYLDPPYNSRQYPPYYHILETISYNDKPKIYGKTGRRPYKDKISPFCFKKKALNSILDIIKRAKFENIFISYSSEGIIPINILYENLKENFKCEIFDLAHRRYKSNGIEKPKTKIEENIIYVRK